MSLLAYFLSPLGRITRQEYWLGMLVLMTITVPVSMLLDPAAFTASASDKVTAPTFAGTVWNLILTWPSAAISIKRFNDRDWPHWLGYLLGVLMAALVLANYHGMLLDPDRMNPIEKLALVVFVVAFIWALIENGFQRGTEGHNGFGPDPLQTRGDIDTP